MGNSSSEKGVLWMQYDIEHDIALETRTDFSIDSSFAISPQGLQAVVVEPVTFGDLELGLLDLSNSFFTKQRVRWLTNNEIHDTSAAWSPDGYHIAFVRGSYSDTSSLFIMDVVTGQEWMLTEAPNNALRNIAWSPDGTQLAFTDGRPVTDAYVVNVHETSPPPYLVRRYIDSSYAAITWTPDGMSLVMRSALEDNEPLVVLHVVTGEFRELPTPSGNYADFTWTADGYWLTFTHYASFGPSHIAMLNIETGEFRCMCLVEGEYPFWLP